MDDARKMELLTKAIDKTKELITLEKRRAELLGQMLMALEYQYQKANKENKK